ncbi:adipocyte plasma membrane-associated [Brachionus plicatilis]|uniref:Adipocyte plasma membrane-associated n=1 Tax=Brachionus plicatilis TaxID=10195 RepID=A0A3M7SHU4_BRAPC|nr:adipocyte plasma membrane-associated [Brachionus plicatilis]
MKKVEERPRQKSDQKKWILIGLFVALGALFVFRFPLFCNNLSRNIQSSIIQLPALVPLEGGLKPNEKLTKAERVQEGVLVGPETIEFDKDGFFYTGLVNGQVVKVDSKNTSNIQLIAQMGSLGYQYCKSVREIPIKNCGRPLGLRLDKTGQNLYIADAYYGIFKINLQTKKLTSIVKADDVRFGNKPMKLVNDLDLDGDLIYFIDSSFLRHVDSAIEEHIEANPRGRLFSYNQKTNEMNLLLDGLYFPNGLQLSPQKDFLLINENSMAKIIKFYLVGEKKGKVELFAFIPGFGDTIRLTQNKTLLVPFASVRPSILDYLAEWPNLRNIMFKILNFKYLFKILPKYGLLAEYGMDGVAIRSWHDPKGVKIECTTAGAIYDNKLYLGSFYNSFLGIVNLN